MIKNILIKTFSFLVFVFFSQLNADKIYLLPDDFFVFQNDIKEAVSNSKENIFILTSKFEDIQIFKALKEKSKKSDINISIISNKYEILEEHNLISALAMYSNIEIRLIQGLQKTDQQSDVFLLGNKLFIFSSKITKTDFNREYSVIYMSENNETNEKFKEIFYILLNRSEEYFK